MKIKIKMAAILLASAALFTVSCKKESADPVPTTDKLMGKWTFVSLVTNDFYLGASHIDTTTGNANEYVDFRTDGKVYSYVWTDYDTASYVRINDTKIWIGSPADTSTITVLTDTDLHLYQKQVFSPTEYSETTLYFTK